MSISRIGGNSRYSEAVVHNNTVYLSGQVPWKSEGADIRVQCQEVFANVEKQLKAAGSSVSKILSMTIYLRDPAEYEAMNSVYDAWIPMGCAPARATICNVLFPNLKWKVEVTAIAAV
jgi:enamine deaminase RidA (YjgF/YER057c/UK114 family)